MGAELLELIILATIKVQCRRTVNRSAIPHYAYTYRYVV